MYKGRPVFGRITKPYFKPEAKEYVTQEACFVFIDGGEIFAELANPQFQDNASEAIHSFISK